MLELLSLLSTPADNNNPVEAQGCSKISDAVFEQARERPTKTKMAPTPVYSAVAVFATDFLSDSGIEYNTNIY